MSIRFYFGPTDGALSRKVYGDVIARAVAQEERRFFVIVPDQFTMQTQKELSLMHPRGGILNIDVLSFGRLSHRILEEVDCREIPVLDDTGKSLVLQKITEKAGEKLPVLGGFLRRQGYIHEIKSAVSEFMQYGISPEQVGELAEYAKEKRLLAGKLQDLRTIYGWFEEYIRDHFVTAEETLDMLRRNLSKSNLLRGSVVVLDGFTGFTPIQYRLLQEMAGICDEMIITMVCGPQDSPYRLDGEQKLFYLTKKTVNDLERLAEEADIPRDRREDVFLQESREGGELSFLQKHLFRYDGQVYQGQDPSFGEGNPIRLFEAVNPAQEVHQAAVEIRRLLQRGLAFRDMVMLTGDLEGYAPYVESEFERMGIPCFLDRTHGIALNPFTEFLLSALNLSLKNYSYEAVFHYLRSGMTGIRTEEIDRLENYVLAAGIRSKRAYQNRFVKKPRYMDQADEKALDALNATRETFFSQVEMLSGKKKDKACHYVERLYDFLRKAQCQKKLEEMAGKFEEEGDGVRAREYGQIYRLVVDLLDQIYRLLGDEEINLQEFVDILNSGIAEIQVGTIPQNVDRILVGDMERTRFKPVKVLFFLGVNDGIIPRNASKGGIISDMEREFLKNSAYELAPTPRQQMFIQRFYLYLNFTKPSELLYLSFARQGSDGKTLRPAYLIESLRKLFPKLSVEYPQNLPAMEQIMTVQQGRELLASGLRRYAEGLLEEDEKRQLFTLYECYGDPSQQETREQYERAAFARYEEAALSKEIARLIYSATLRNSVSRLETYAECAYKHFLQYGLALKEREEFGFEAVDQGSVYHHVLEGFSRALGEKGKTWFDFDESFARETVSTLLESEAAQYGGSVLYSTQRNVYQMKRMERILIRTVITLQKQLQKGVFLPEDYEVHFTKLQELSEGERESSEEKQELSEGERGSSEEKQELSEEDRGSSEEKQELSEEVRGSSGKDRMRIVGIIDRIDTAQDDSNVYVKVVDYKSGDKKFDLVAMYYGLQLQLVVYMNAALEREKRLAGNKEAVPAALLYYHVEDPLVESDKELSEEELNAEILKALRAKGIVNGKPEIVRLLDQEFKERSDVIPVERKKDGSYSVHSSVMSGEQLKEISQFVDRKLTAFGKEILGGRIALDPYERKDANACSFCPFAKVCGFDRLLPGCRRRPLEEMTEEEVMDRIVREEK